MYFHTGLAEYILFESLHTGNVGSESVIAFFSYCYYHYYWGEGGGGFCIVPLKIVTMGKLGQTGSPVLNMFWNWYSIWEWHILLCFV